jgi:hypothetical protein
VHTLFASTYKKVILFILFVFAVFSNTELNAQFYSGSQTDFGKNRVKYDDYFWTYYSYPKYDVYFYEQGRELSNYVSQSAKLQMEKVEKLFDYTFDDKVQFIVYNKQSDYRQSNIGLSTEEDYNTGGVTRVEGSKVILYYEGDHAKLDAQIRAGLAEVLINEMMYGGNVREMVKNSTLLNLPEWYIKGLVEYVSYDWNSDIDNRVKDGIVSGRYTNINRLEGSDAKYAGHAMWKHIADNYGEAVISNILYMTKVSRNIDNSSLFVLGISVKNLWRECFDSYSNKYIEKDTARTLPAQLPLVVKKPKAARIYSQLKVSPDGNYVLYTTNEMGQYKIWLYDVQKNKTKRILKSGQKIDRPSDQSFPLLAWHPSGKLFSYIIERKSYLVFTTYELESKDRTERNIIGFEKILDYSYNDDGRRFVMSAVQKGQTDIFVFTAASSAYDQITKDIYDDLTPRFVHGSKQIAFASNRPLDTLFYDAKRKVEPAMPYKDLFVFDNVIKSRVLKRVTNTPNIDESYPADYDSTHISYLSDINGIRNRFIARFDSVIAYVDTSAHYRTVVSSYPITNYKRSILEQDVNTKANKFSEIIFENGKYKLFIGSLTPAAATPKLNLKNTSYRDYKDRIDRKEAVEASVKDKNLRDTPAAENVKIVIDINDTPKKDSSQIDINNYTFENEQPKKRQDAADQKKPLVDTTAAAIVNPNSDFVLSKQRNYNINYSVDYVVSQIDNSFLNASYQKFAGGGSPIYLNPGINAFFKVGVSDLFEDYRIVGGIRFSGDLNSNEFFLSRENRIKNIDKQIVLHRQSLLDVADNYSIVKVYTHEAKYILKYPFSEVASVRGTFNYRNDKIVYTATDLTNLKRENSFENWGSLKLEWVYDNSIKKGLNLYNGSRAKVFGEYYRQIDKVKTDFFVVGLDARNYKKIHRDLIWANRIAASTSFGNKKLIYYMGGVDNWFNPKFDNTTNIATDQNYTYQTLATNMRGFYQNVRNGNSFVVINSELRFPIFKYFFKRPIRSDFIQNFQIIGFGDLGTAWTGNSPYSENNSLNTTVIGSNITPLIITLKTQHNPIVGGYGFGLRSRIFGYFIRIDRAWGVQDGIVLKPIWHLSLSLDF